MEDFHVDTFEGIEEATRHSIQKYEEASAEEDIIEDKELLASELALIILRARAEAPGMPIAEFNEHIFRELDSAGVHSSVKEWVLEIIIEKLLQDDEEKHLTAAIHNLRERINRLL